MLEKKKSEKKVSKKKNKKPEKLNNHKIEEEKPEKKFELENLEDVISNDEEFFVDDVPVNFFQSGRGTAPVLERIAGEQEINARVDFNREDNFSGNKNNQPLYGGKMEEGEVKYDRTLTENRSYQTGSENSMLRQSRFSGDTRQEFLDPLKSMMSTENNINQKMIEPEFADEKKRQHFEGREKKYREFR